jgi:predicted dinucleotide-binding enzyme
MSTLTILGAGNMARGIATRALAGGTGVQLLGRDRQQAETLAKDLQAAARLGAMVESGQVGDTLAGDVIVLAVPYAAAGELLRRYGGALDGKVVVDITNPVNGSFDGLVTPPDSSAAEQLAATVPGASVVKAWNTTFAGTLVAGEVAGQPLDVFLAGDDAQAKSAVAAIVEAGGSVPVDAGGLSAARALESFQFLHMALQFSRGTQFGSTIKILA